GCRRGSPAPSPRPLRGDRSRDRARPGRRSASVGLPLTQDSPLEEIAVDEELAGPVGIQEGAVAPIDGEGALHRPPRLGGAFDLDGAPDILIGGAGCITVGGAAGLLVEQEPAASDLGASGQAGPSDRPPPVPPDP